VGSSRPPAADVDLVDSYARQVGGEVEVVLASPGPEIADGATVVLRRREASFRGTLGLLDGDGGRRGVVRFGRSALTDGQYAVLLADGAEERPLGCRLLVQGARPLVLLWGAEASKSRLPVPHERPQAARTPVQRARSLAGRTKRAVSRRVRTLPRRGR
jgi:hypothetical protein